MTKNVVSSLIYAIVATTLLIGIIYNYSTYYWIKSLGVAVVFMLWVLYPKFNKSDIWLRERK